jgi:hypothetical protein
MISSKIVGWRGHEILCMQQLIELMVNFEEKGDN